MDDNDEIMKKFTEELIKALTSAMSKYAGSTVPEDVIIEVHEGDGETMVLVEIPGVMEDGLEFELVNKEDMEHIQAPGEYKVLHLKAFCNINDEVDVGIKIPIKYNEVKTVSVRNGVVEIILV